MKTYTGIRNLKQLQPSDLFGTVSNLFAEPSHVHIAMANHSDLMCKCQVEEGDYVRKGQVIGLRQGNIEFPIVSSVSGKVIKIDKMFHESGRKVETVVIENDFKNTLDERYNSKLDINSLSREDLISKMKEYGILGLGGAGFPTYIKYQNTDSIDTLIVNMVECEPVESSVLFNAYNNIDMFVEALLLIKRIADVKKIVICMKNYQVKLHSKLTTALNLHEEDTSNISVKKVKNKYPNGWEKRLVKLVTKKTYKNLPSDVGVIVSNGNTIFEFYRCLLENRPLTETIVTISGTAVNEEGNYLILNGTPIEHIVSILSPNKDELDIILGGPMMGVNPKSLEIGIPPNINSLIINLSTKIDLSSPCISCGKCISHCPTDLKPVFINEVLKANDKDKMLESGVDRCIQCGTCSYICPSRIELTDAMAKAKLRVTVMKKKKGAK